MNLRKIWNTIYIMVLGLWEDIWIYDITKCEIHYGFAGIKIFIWYDWHRGFGIWKEIVGWSFWAPSCDPFELQNILVGLYRQQVNKKLIGSMAWGNDRYVLNNTIMHKHTIIMINEIDEIRAKGFYFWCNKNCIGGKNVPKKILFTSRIMTRMTRNLNRICENSLSAH